MKARYVVYSILKSGNAKIDTKTDCRSSVYMVEQALKGEGVSGYTFDVVLKKVINQF